MDSLVVGFLAAFLLAAVPGQPVIALLRRLGARQNVSADAPVAHGAKQGTPTMGGLLILGAHTLVVLGFCLVALLARQQDIGLGVMLPVLLMTLGFGAIGFLDDFLSTRRGKNLGLKAREKFSAQCLIAIGFALWLARASQPNLTTSIALTPTLSFGDWVLGGKVVDLGIWYYPLAVLFIVALSNATNFTDGLDGLASGVILFISLTLALLLLRTFYPALTFFTIALAGALAGFLWWNAHPAKVFMGDTGALALGAALAGVALVSKQEMGLIVASLVCWAELFSVMIQVLVFKWRRRRHGLEYARAHRIFRRSPLHHHFEEIGWPETQVVTRFWIAGLCCALLALLWNR
jgi:phospho-N-acetylmuramoyl-pentapeptide-transferase